MRRLAALLVAALCLAVPLAGCQGGEAASEGASSASAGQEAPAALADGTYAATVKADSSMVQVIDCPIAVQDGAITADMTMVGEGFSRIYLGTSEEAAAADDGDIIDAVVNDEGKYVFVGVPVSGLDEDVTVALWGQRRDRWYDHVLVFSLADDAASADGDGAQEGTVSAPVTLEGGSGKADVESPALLRQRDDGTWTATIVWSSSNYDLMIVDGEEYLPTTISPSSTFVIPVSLDAPDMAVQAETTAMSEPHLIDYTLHFDFGGVQ